MPAAWRPIGLSGHNDLKAGLSKFLCSRCSGLLQDEKKPKTLFSAFSWLLS